jgi:hypothetical protein
MVIAEIDTRSREFLDLPKSALSIGQLPGRERAGECAKSLTFDLGIGCHARLFDCL